jgi:hypothetical protein
MSWKAAGDGISIISVGIREMKKQRVGEDKENVILLRGRTVIVDNMTFKLVREA